MTLVKPHTAVLLSPDLSFLGEEDSCGPGDTVLDTAAAGARHQRTAAPGGDPVLRAPGSAPVRTVSSVILSA